MVTTVLVFRVLCGNGENLIGFVQHGGRGNFGGTNYCVTVLTEMSTGGKFRSKIHV